MKRRTIVLLVLGLVMVTSCFDDADDNVIAVSEINDFVWKGLNAFYVYKDSVPNLANDAFGSNDEYSDYLNSFSTPEAIFESLIYQSETVDRFSRIFPNFFDLEALLQGTSLSNGMSFRLTGVPNDDLAVFGYVRYVSPGTNAESQGVQRGMVFNAVDGTPLTRTNFRSLLFGSNANYTINLATYDDNGTPAMSSDDIITSTNQSIDLTKVSFTENPILTNNVTTIGTDKIGYLMYNGFRFADSNLTELNNVFANFQAENITDLVLDLRYNGGGSVSTAIWLSSMITGQFTGDTFFTEEWNSQIQSFLEAENPAAINNPFVNQMVKVNSNGDVTFQQSINSLNLGRVYILTSRTTASASELVINGLRPYIDVVQIGATTTGKPQASITIYDSPDFSRNSVNVNHTYAMQPQVYESANASGFSSYYSGLTPTIEAFENLGNLGVLGDVNEPLFALAIAEITGAGRSPNTSNGFEIINIADSDFENPMAKKMFDTNLPSNILNIDF